MCKQIHHLLKQYYFNYYKNSVQFSHAQLSATTWTAARQSFLSITNFLSLLKFMSITLVMPSNHLILCGPLLVLPSSFPSIQIFCNESVFYIRWPEGCIFSFSISLSNEYSGLISSGLSGMITWQPNGLSRVFSNTTVQKHQCFRVQPSLWSNSHIHT